jgi:hypothetical protein
MRAGLLFLLIVFFSCENGQNCCHPGNMCDVENPAEEIDWLREELENGGHKNPSTHSDTFVYKAIYNNQVVFYISICCPTCDVAPPEVKTCSGESLGFLGSDVDQRDLKNSVVVWRTENGVCP